jgi:hypothetical protein
MMSLCEIARLPAPFMGIFEAANMMWEGQQSPPLAAILHKSWWRVIRI